MFPGFYNTVLEYDREDEDIQYYNEENKTSLSYDDFEWNYADYEMRVGKKFVNRLESELRQYLPIKMEYENIYSPKEYNFKNDSINITVKLNLDKLIKIIKEDKKAAIYFKDHYTSCSGFISFHSNRIEDWTNKKYILEKPDHRIGALLDCLCWLKLSDENIYYWCDDEYYMSYSPIEQTV